jgi:hypothetical protein
LLPDVCDVVGSILAFGSVLISVDDFVVVCGSVGLGRLDELFDVEVVARAVELRGAVVGTIGLFRAVCSVADDWEYW